MSILDANLLKCNPLQAMVTNWQRGATDCAEPLRWSNLTRSVPWLKGPGYAVYLDKTQKITEGLDIWGRRSKIPPISGEIPGR